MTTDIKQMSMRVAVLQLLEGLRDQLGGDLQYYTATDIQLLLRARMARDEKLSSLSSLLLKMVRNGQLEEMPGVGPRGGMGYRLR